MKLPRRRFLHLAAGAAALPAMSRIASAQTYPSRPITMVVTYPAGSAMDTGGRIVAERMRLSLGQPVIIALAAPVFGQPATDASIQARNAPADDAAKVLVGRLDLERYKAAIKGLTQFGDRLQGTDRNRAAVDWIEAQLRSYGCMTERISYTYDAPLPASPPPQQSAGTAPSRVIASGEIRPGAGGSRLRGITRPAGPNNNPDAQSDPALRALNAQPPAPGMPRRGVLHESRRHAPG
jgi:hypothetical protein